MTLKTAQAAPAAAEGNGDDFGDWADTDADAATVGGVPSALVPYLRAWTLLLKVPEVLRCGATCAPVFYLFARRSCCCAATGLSHHGLPSAIQHVRRRI